MKKFAFALIIFGLIGVAAPRAFAQCITTNDHACISISGPVFPMHYPGVPASESTILGTGQMPVTPPEGAPVAQASGAQASLLKWFRKYCSGSMNVMRPCVEIAAVLRNEEESGGSSASSISLSPLDHSTPPPKMNEGTYKVLSIVESPENGDNAWLIATQGDGAPKVYRVPNTSLPAKLSDAGPGTLDKPIILKVSKTFSVIGGNQ